MTLTIPPTTYDKPRIHTPTKTAWFDRLHSLRKRIDNLPAPGHPSVRHMLDYYEEWLDLGLSLEYLTPEEAARA